MLRLCFVILLVTQTIANYAQGLINNNAFINLNSGVSLYIDGTSGNYTSQSGGIIFPSATSTLVLEGNWNNNSANTGFTTDAGNVFLAGTTQTITGTNATAFYNLSLDVGGIKTLGVTSTTVGGSSNFTGVLAINSGTLDLNSNRIDITNSAIGAVTSAAAGYIISETNLAVNPSIMRWYMRTTTGSHVFPFGVGGLKIPFTFNITGGMAGANDYVDVSTRATAASNNIPWAGASNVAAVNLMYAPNGPFADGSDEAVIDRWWDITPSGTPTANVTFSYRGIENTMAAPYNVGNVGAQYWTGVGWATDNASFGSAVAVSGAGVVGSVTATGLNQFCPWALSSKIVPLPIELLNFDARCLNNETVLEWCTASELNNNYFTIEYSSDGKNFQSIANIYGNGTTSEKHCYKYITSPGLTDITYFRLKQTDYNNKTSYSRIITIESCNKKSDQFVITNNGSHQIAVIINSTTDNSFELNIHNALGQVIDSKRLEITKGLNTIPMDFNYLCNGIYYVSISDSFQKLICKKVLLSDIIN